MVFGGRTTVGLSAHAASCDCDAWEYMHTREDESTNQRKPSLVQVLWGEHDTGTVG